MLPAKVDKFDERNNELNEIKTAFNEFVAKVSIFDKIIGDGASDFKDPLLSYIKPRFDKLFDILYSTNENNRAKGIKDYSTNVPDARSKFESFEESERLPCSFKDLGKKISVLVDQIANAFARKESHVLAKVANVVAIKNKS